MTSCIDSVAILLVQGGQEKNKRLYVCKLMDVFLAPAV